ncbi:MAG: tRNA pseudouridine(38-40) synthase TruA [Planctomycetota bacterium]
MRTITVMERNLKLLIAYDGTRFHGWQHQPGLDTVQGVVEQAARRVLRHRVEIMGSGRTDAGVHAAGQVANVFTTCTIPAYNLMRALGSRLPKDISLREVIVVSTRFHARNSAESKLYRYRIHNRPSRPVERLQQRYTYHYWHPLNLDRMRAAARYFEGTLDFSAMASAGCKRESMVRTVFRCEIARHFDEITVDVVGSGFLYNQVRNMVGTLIEVGRGRWGPEQVKAILDSRDRKQAGPTAPARGLCLQWVCYPPEVLVPDCEPAPVSADAVPPPDAPQSRMEN